MITEIVRSTLKQQTLIELRLSNQVKNFSLVLIINEKESGNRCDKKKSLERKILIIIIIIIKQNNTIWSILKNQKK